MRRSVTFGRIILLPIVALLSAACSSAGGEAGRRGGGGDVSADLPDANAAAVMEYVNETNPYHDWGSWPTDQWNDFNVNLVSGAPHGNVVRIYVNSVALAAADSFDGSLPEGSMIVKENYVGTDPETLGKLDALTVMYKVDGFNPDASDWFWVKAKPDGSQIDAEGAVEGCIGCHSQENNHDFVLRYGFGEEPAVATLDEGSE